MNKVTKTILALSTVSLLLTGCESMDEKKAKQTPKATTIEEIQAEKGKPARVIKTTRAKLNDVRKFSGTIEGSQQNYVISKMSDPLAQINVKVGSNVQKDQVIAEYIFTGDNTAYQQAQEQVGLLEKATERMRDLHAKGGITQQDMDSQEMQLKIAKMGLETARRASKILSPSSGTVISMNYQPGQVPGVGGVLCTIAKLDKVILKLNVTSQDIGLFKKGATATVNLNGQAIKGKVTTIPLAANLQNRAFPVEITFDNKKRQLLPGMFVTAELDARQVDGIVVPTDAVVYRNGINAVWTVTDEGIAKRKVVKVGVSTKTDAQILDGLEEGETIMIEGMSRMNDGDKVLIVE
ncbi:MAG: efflux RND transporter periplasmic adaptor subunit [Fibrobacter sp.]|nr:efflux RND transporter periplasmic adaptor subunit [Fibrobacter sp.]